MAKDITLRLDFDYSDLRHRLAGISADNIRKNPELKKILTHVGMLTKDKVEGAIKTAIPHDPRSAYKALRMLAFTRKEIGAAVTIVSGRSKGKSSGTKRKMNEYQGEERGFILNWMNTGTVKRKIGGRMQRVGSGKRRKTVAAKKGEWGYRGRLKGRRYFAPTADPAMRHSADVFSQRLVQMINKQFDA